MSGSLQAEMQAIREGAAFAPITDRAFLRITGSDATRWLNGMVTNSIQALQPGEGNYNFLLNAQGRIQGDCTIYREPGDGDPAFLLETGSWQLETVQQILDKFIIMDDVEMTRGLAIYGSAAAGLRLTGAKASETLAYIASDTYENKLAPLAPGAMAFGSASGGGVVVLASPAATTPSFDVWFNSAKEREISLTVLRGLGAIEISESALEASRVSEGRPRYGVDIRDRDLPQETNQPHALHFAKGCYLGQEIVERIRSRGQVHRLFTAFRLEGDLLSALPMPLEANGKPAGELTSAALVPTPEGDQLLALGYARREALETNQTFTYAGGTAIPRTP